MPSKRVIWRNAMEARYGSYEAYIKSPEWAERRQRRIEFDGGKCQTCGRTTDLQVHHRNYDHIGTEEEFADLITLCSACHKRIHKGRHFH